MNENSLVSTKPVLLTGITGYIGSRIAVDLLNRGYAVRGTMRNAAKRDKIVPAIAEHAPTDKLEVISANLLDASSWTAAAQGCECVMHVASPIAAIEPDDPQAMIDEARNGALHVLAAATEAGVRRVVMTSSMAAIGYGLDGTPASPMTETRWTDPAHPDNTTYVRSKTIAERAAWDFVRDTPGAPELVTVNPGAVLGPLLTTSLSDSHLIVTKMLKGEFPGVPKFGFELVDVRDVSDLHIKALEHHEAAGERYLAVAGLRDMMDIKEVLAKAAPTYKSKLPKFKLPDFVVRLFAKFDKETAGVLNELGRRRIASSQKARTQLGWQPRSPEEAIEATAADVIRLGLV